MLTTKQRIMNESLNLFSEKGYEAVSVAQIANAVGIKPPSLYKHYKSKNEIFNAIVAEMSNRYKKQMATMQMNGEEAMKDVEFYKHIEERQLIEIGKSIFSFFLHDDYISKFRRLLTIEQYHNSDLAAQYAKQYVIEPLQYQEMLFTALIDAGCFISGNPKIMALHFFSPLFLLLQLCDCQPEKEVEILQMVEQHIQQFNQLYGLEGRN